MPHLRRAGPADVALVRTMTLAAYAKWVPIMGIKPLPMLADYNRAVVDHRIDLLIEGEPVALIETVARERDVMIENLCVDPAHQGRGFASLLLAHADALAFEAGHGTLRLYTNRLMADNIALYRRNGFLIERENVLNGRSVVHMVKLGARDGNGAPDGTE